MPKDPEIESALEAAVAAVRQAGAHALSGFGVAPIANRKSQGAWDVVTQFDTEVERLLIHSLSEYDPSIGFWGEEFGKSGSADTFWIMDPIDGTAAFMRGIPFATVMIGLIHQGQVIVSAIHDIAQNKTYSAGLGLGATVDGRPINVSDREMHDSFVCTFIDPELDPDYKILRNLDESFAMIRLAGSGWEYLMIASGRLEGKIAYGPRGCEWDYAPGSLLVSEAGGVVRNIGSSSYDYMNKNFLAVTPKVYEGLTSGVDPVFPIVG